MPLAINRKKRDKRIVVILTFTVRNNVQCVKLLLVHVIVALVHEDLKYKCIQSTNSDTCGSVNSCCLNVGAVFFP